MSSTSPHPILIIGAGIGGLTLAQSLLKANIPFRVFERDSSSNRRNQGYRVRISQEAQSYISQSIPANLFEKLKACCPGPEPGLGRPGPTLDAVTGNLAPNAAMTIGPRNTANFDGSNSGNGPMLRPPPGPNAQRPLSTDRTVWRNILLIGLEQHVEFDKEFQRYEVNPSGVSVNFKDGSRVQGSMLVGADGAWSKVRRQLYPNYPLYESGGKVIYGKTTLTPQLQEALNIAEINRLTVINESDDNSQSPKLLCLLEPMRFSRSNDNQNDLPADYIYWVLVLQPSIPITITDEEFGNLTSPQAAALAQSLTSHWNPSFHTILANQNTDQTLTQRLVVSGFEIPVPSPSPSRLVTLIGDAIHTLLPMQAMGTTTALHDAVTLSQAIRDGGVKTESIERYEQEMRGYAEEAIRGTLGIKGAGIFGIGEFEGMRVVEGRW